MRTIGIALSVGGVLTFLVFGWIGLAYYAIGLIWIIGFTLITMALAGGILYMY